MRTLNLGILAHVDAGKTTLSERLLYTAGAIDHVGSVDAGTTQTDSLELERERGITIRSAVASFLVGDLAVNLVDTPGHPDFIAEVERVLAVLDGAILVVSAVEGVQPQTPLLFRALRRLDVPTLIFVNKIDRAGADPGRVVEALKRRLAPSVVAMATVLDPGSRTATVEPFEVGDQAHRTALTEILAEHDEGILRAYLGDEASLSGRELREQLAVQTRRAVIHPVFSGSAALGIGVDELLAGVEELLGGAHGDPNAPVSGRVFKIERTASGERVAYARLFAGTLRPRERVIVGAEGNAKATSIRVFAPAGAPRRDHVSAGEMATIRGLGSVRVGDALGDPPSGVEATARFPRPTLEAVVYATKPDQQGSLRAALAQLAEQDPLIDVRQDEDRHEISVSLYGEVQKEVIQATLERDYGIAAGFRETTAVCIERPARVGEADEVIHARTHTNITGRSSPFSTNPFMATLGLRIEPAPIGSGVAFRHEVEPRLIPLYLFKTVETMAVQMEAFVREALTEGLAGWQVTDCRVTMNEIGYASPLTSAADYRRLTQLVMMTALERAGTWVCEPLADLTLDVPSSTASGVVAALGQLGGRVTGQFSANGLSTIGAVLPVSRVRGLQHRLPGLTMGEGILEQRFGGYQPIGDNPPRRERSAPNPLDRDAWLASLAKRG
ncbi:MAG: TetM/TetW/TetO/TetS family tetracycline resistance ribosomal protection protein [Chloroflexota bacterium]|nr:TetM/TetW/TetO/TetS family tetracycline resistance ribosomal protection protein [Chloroflexota bacterium]